MLEIGFLIRRNPIESDRQCVIRLAKQSLISTCERILLHNVYHCTSPTASPSRAAGGGQRAAGRVGRSRGRGGPSPGQRARLSHRKIKTD